MDYEQLDDITECYAVAQVPFIDPNTTLETFKPEPNLTIQSACSETKLECENVAESTFNGNWSDEADDDFSTSENDPTTSSKSAQRRKQKKKSDAVDSRKLFWSHKIRSLAGKIACKYCDTVFAAKGEQMMHSCQYLQCDSKNFICRICNKELSRKTFSNHLHETLDCQYCGKKFVNPRNMKAHIKSTHKNDKFIPPNLPKREFDCFAFQQKAEGSLLDETTGLMVSAAGRRKRYPRKTGRFECGEWTLSCDCSRLLRTVISDLCGRIFTTLRSLKAHMDLHTSKTSLVFNSIFYW